MTQEDLLESALTQMMEADVERLWPDMAVADLANWLSYEYGRTVSPRLVYSMHQRIKRRLDSKAEPGAD
jgi:hypothetical protein